jgi:hypothetical protein
LRSFAPSARETVGRVVRKPDQQSNAVPLAAAIRLVTATN